MKMFKCKKCSLVFISKLCLDSHKRTHGGIRFPCTVCTRSYSFKSNLSRHIKKAHETKLSRSVQKKNSPDMPAGSSSQHQDISASSAREVTSNSVVDDTKDEVCLENAENLGLSDIQDKEIIKKWKDLRETFKREFQNFEKSGSSMKKKSKYCYVDVLSFFQPSLIARTTEENVVFENKNEISDINIKDSPESPACDARTPTTSIATKVPPKQNEQKLTIFQENVLNAKEKNQTHTKQDELFDENKHFLLSLLSSMKRMDGEKNFQFRIEVMETMKKYVTSQ